MPSAEAHLHVYKVWFAQSGLLKNGIMASDIPTEAVKTSSADGQQKAIACKAEHAIKVFANRAQRKWKFETAKLIHYNSSHLQ